jgi:hypothetical protein
MIYGHEADRKIPHLRRDVKFIDTNSNNRALPWYNHDIYFKVYYLPSKMAIQDS